jgi:hypothetical protein
MMFGRRWDTDLRCPWDFSSPDWERTLAVYAVDHGNLGVKSAYDYFLFPKGAWGGTNGYDNFPPLAIGRPPWDNWIVFWALAHGMDVVNASDFVLAVHQNHAYNLPGGKRETYGGPEAQRNLALASDERYLYGTLDATHWINRRGTVLPLLSPSALRRRMKTLPDLLRVRLLGIKKWKP